MWAPTSSSLTRQAWVTQQRIIDDMGEGLGLGQAPERSVASSLGQFGIDKNSVATCGTGFLAAGFAGYVAGRIGVLPTAVGVGIAYAILKSMER